MNPAKVLHKPIIRGVLARFHFRPIKRLSPHAEHFKHFVLYRSSLRLGSFFFFVNRLWTDSNVFISVVRHGDRTRVAYWITGRTCAIRATTSAHSRSTRPSRDTRHFKMRFAPSNCSYFERLSLDSIVTSKSPTSPAHDSAAVDYH